MIDPELRDIEKIAESDNTTFPYEGCRTLLARNPGEYQGLIPDLDLYLSTVASYALGASRIASWDEDRRRRGRNDLACSFFELHPEYELLQRDITDDITPDLYEQLRFHEELRLRVLAQLRRLT